MFTVLLAMVLAMDTPPTDCEVQRAVVHSIDPTILFRVARSASQVIAEGRRTEIVDEAWLRRLLARINYLPSSPKQRVPRDIRLVVVLECGGDKSIRLALSGGCGCLDINSAPVPYDPELFDLIVEKIHAEHRGPWEAVGAFCRKQLKKSKVRKATPTLKDTKGPGSAVTP